MDERIASIQRILECTGALFHNLNPSRDRAWQDVDLTMPQLKALICVVKYEGATSGQVARSLGVGLSTVTGIVDRLAEQNFVTRREDASDRRITRVIPTPTGQQLVDELLRYRNEAIMAVLSRLDAEQLQTVETAFRYLLGAVNEIAAEHQQSLESVV
jgi:DNA-binding MarR family transcriptional regulator